MKTDATQALMAEILNGASYANVNNAGTTYVWSATNFTNDTLRIIISWYWFPEFSQIRYTLSTEGLVDLSNNHVQTNIVRSFVGPTQHSTYTADYTTQDVNTGLVWKSRNEGKSGADGSTGSPAAVTWHVAVNQCAARFRKCTSLRFTLRSDGGITGGWSCLRVYHRFSPLGVAVLLLL